MVMGWDDALLFAGGSALSGLLGGGDKKSSTTPQIEEQYRPLLSNLYYTYLDKLKNPGADLSGYAGTGVSNINSVYDLAKMVRSNNLTRRGLSTSPVAAVADEMGDSARIGKIAEFQNTLPLMQRQFQQENQSGALNLIRTLMGQQQTVQGNPAGDAANSTMDMLAYLYGKGAFGK